MTDSAPGVPVDEAELAIFLRSLTFQQRVGVLDAAHATAVFIFNTLGIPIHIADDFAETVADIFDELVAA